jgi:hypothetical protein
MEIKVGIAYTKPSAYANKLCDMFSASLSSFGDKPVHIYRSGQIGLVHKCSVIFQISEYNPAHGGKLPGHMVLRKELVKFGQKNKVPRLILDTGFLKNNRLARLDWNRYFAIGINGVKRDAKYVINGKSNVRWKKLNLKIKPWITKGDNILILGQTRFGLSTYSFDVFKWYEKTVKQIRQFTDKPIYYRGHPNEPGRPRLDKVKFITDVKTRSIEKDLKDAHCAIVSTTNGGIESVLNGIPVFTDNPTSMVYDLAEKNWAKINDPLRPERQDFFNFCANNQWLPSELENGEFWKSVRHYFSS